MRSTTNYIIYLIKFLIVSAILYYLFTSSLLDFKIISKITHDVKFISKLILIIFFVTILGNLKWFILLRSQNIKISFSQCFYLYYIGYTFNYFLPGGIAGDAVKIGYIAKRSNNRSATAMSIIVDRVVGLIAMGLVILFFIPSIFEKINKLKWIVIDYHEFIIPYFITISILTVSGFILVLSFVNNKKIYKKFTNYFKNRKSKINVILLKVIRALFAYRKLGITLILNILLAIFIQIIIALCLLFIGQKILHSDISLFSYTLSSIITQLISIIPISPGGIGVGEISFSKVLYYLNDRILLGYASIYFAFRMLNILACIPGIILFIFGQKHLVKKS